MRFDRRSFLRGLGLGFLAPFLGRLFSESPALPASDPAPTVLHYPGASDRDNDRLVVGHDGQALVSIYDSGRDVTCLTWVTLPDDYMPGESVTLPLAP